MTTSRFTAALIASGGATAAGVVITAAASLIAGSASGEINGTAPGATITATASLIPGAADGGGGNATAPGVTLTATSSLIAGSASGETNGTASGATVTATVSMIAGSANGGPSNNIRLQPGLYLERGGYAASLTGLRWWVLNSAMTEVENSGTGATTNSSGQITIDISASASWVVGDYVPLWIADYNAATSAPDRTVRSGLFFVPAIAQP